MALFAAALVGGFLVLALRDRGPAKLDCPPEQVHLDDEGVARCAPGKALTASQGLVVGKKADLNTVTVDELAQLPGIGQTLAEAIVERRKQLGKFQSFDEVDAVSGVGPAKLSALKQMVEIK